MFLSEVAWRITQPIYKLNLNLFNNFIYNYKSYFFIGTNFKILYCQNTTLMNSFNIDYSFIHFLILTLDCHNLDGHLILNLP